MWMNFDSPNFPSLCSLSAIILFQTCSNIKKCILYVFSCHKCIKIKYKTVNMYGIFLWLVQSSSRWNTIHSHRNYHVQLLSVRVSEFCHPARSPIINTTWESWESSIASTKPAQNQENHQFTDMLKCWNYIHFHYCSVFLKFYCFIFYWYFCAFGQFSEVFWQLHNLWEKFTNYQTFLLQHDWIIIIIIHQLQSRRPQGFSMHDDHQQMRQSAVLALLLHYPQAIFVHN